MTNDDRLEIFLVETNDRDYDTYDSAVIVCKSKDKLQSMFDDDVFSHESVVYGNCNGMNVKFNQNFYTYTSVNITRIGYTTRTTDADAVVVCSSFNAG